ncbi:MAG TPA: M20 family metallopeptidase [Chthonomonadaceae bacterium]|nr:M20 family metallopeptidase [Chthonomonadaceae bacterium]
MSAISKENAARILSDLIALPSVNPMGRPYTGTERIESKVADYIERLFAPYGAPMERDPYSPLHESLMVTVPGQTDGPALFFESHMDTVPADDWPDHAFIPRWEGDTLFGRGACDDKGPLVAMILATMAVLESGVKPPRTVLFLAAGDEENKQTGIKRFREKNVPLSGCIIGEPTRCLPVVQHKGTVRWDITVHGRSAHTSQPELGVNAIYGMMEVLAEIRKHQEEVRQRYCTPLLTGPLLTVSRIQGGRTRNAVPDECTISVDYRIIPGMEGDSAREEVIRRLAALGHKITHHERHIQTEPLQTPLDDPFAQHVLEICRQALGPETQLCGVPYGTDAAWIFDRAPTLVLGPGDIASAHAIDEHIDINEVVRCAEIYRQIMRRLP